MNTQDNIRAESQKDPAQLEREIDQKRGHIEQLVSALESRLSPGEIFDRMMRNGGGKEFASNLADTVKANPVPALLTAAGLVWLYAGRNNPPSGTSSYGSTTTSYGASSEYGSTSSYDTGSSSSSGVRDKMHSAREKVSSAGHRVSDGTRHAASSVRDRASSAGQSVRHGARRANDGMHRLLDENPMAAAGIGIAVGALLGALVPPTRKEDELIGRHSDRLTGKAKELARSGADSLKDASREVTSPQGGSSSQASSSQASSASSAPITPSATTGSSASTGASSGAASRPH